MVFVKDNSLIIDDENFTEDELKKALSSIKTTEKVKIFMSKTLALGSPKMFESLCSVIPNSEIMIKLTETEYDANFNQSQIFDKEQLKVLLSNSAVASAYGSTVFLSGHEWKNEKGEKRENKIPLSKVAIASGKINKWVDSIQSARVNGKPLSPFEKYLYAYQIVTQFKYSEKDIFESRDIARVLSGDSIVCVGFAQILSEICRRVGIPCKRQYIHEMIDGEDDGLLRNHMECIVQLTDSKYGINGFYIADPTIDSYDAQIDNASAISHALMNIDEYENLYAGESEIVFNDTSPTSSYYFLRDINFLPDKKLIEESKSPLKDVQEKIKTPEFCKEFDSFVGKILNNTTVEKDFSGVEIKYNDKIKRFDKISIGEKSYSIDEIARDEKVMATLAVRLYSLSNYEPNPEIEIMEKFLQKAYLKRTLNLKNQEKANVNNLKLSNYLSTNELIMSDPILLAEIGRFEDFKILTESKLNNMKLIGMTKFSTPKMTDYYHALRNVYLANDYSAEDAEIYTKILIQNSVDLAYSHGWDMITTSNPFGQAAKIKYADEINEMEANGLLTPLKDENSQNNALV